MPHLHDFGSLVVNLTFRRALQLLRNERTGGGAGKKRRVRREGGVVVWWQGEGGGTQF